MKNFFTKKSIAFLAICASTLMVLIILLIVPIGSLGQFCLAYDTSLHKFMTLDALPRIKTYLSSPFTLYEYPFTIILVWQTVVFTLVGAIFVVFLALFLVELKKAGAFNRTHRPTKTERLEARIAELEHQVDELKKED